MDVEQIRLDLRDVRVFCGRYFPFVVIPLSYMRIVASESVLTAGVDEAGTLAINPEWWNSLDAEAKRYVAIHEALHVCLCHPFRRKGFDPIIYNIAADGKINSSMEEANVPSISYSPGDHITLNKISQQTGINVEALQRMSTEEIARELEEDAVKVVVKCGVSEGGVSRDLLDGNVGGEVVQEGSVTERKDAKELEGEWKRILERARDFAKQAGNMPTALERIVNEILEVKPPWHLVLRFGIKNHSKQDSSFAYPSRRGDDYPGYYGYHYTVWCLIDASGSISQEELRHFLGVVKYEARKADIYAISWDAEAYEVLKATRPADVARRIAPKMRGGGGTVVSPVLRKVFSLMKPNDAVIVLTDGDISDAEKDETKQLFRKVSAKAGFAMLGYTHKPVDAPGFATARITFDSQSTSHHLTLHYASASRLPFQPTLHRCNV
jgi:predicted metal-dependent peptidase